MQNELEHLQQNKLHYLLQQSYCISHGIDLMNLQSGQNELLSYGKLGRHKKSGKSTEDQLRMLEREEILRLFANGDVKQSTHDNKVDMAEEVLQQWYNELITDAEDSISKFCRNVEIVNNSLSFDVNAAEINLKVVISSSARRRPCKMPSALSSDGSVCVSSSIHLSSLADSVSKCVNDRSNARTMLQEAVYQTIRDEIGIFFAAMNFSTLVASVS